jgi:hypothetical protein
MYRSAAISVRCLSAPALSFRGILLLVDLLKVKVVQPAHQDFI